jgi:hypothetical protein
MEECMQHHWPCSSRSLALIIVITLVFVACTQTTTNPPRDTLPEDTLPEDTLNASYVKGNGYARALQRAWPSAP